MSKRSAGAEQQLVSAAGHIVILPWDTLEGFDPPPPHFFSECTARLIPAAIMIATNGGLRK